MIIHTPGSTTTRTLAIRNFLIFAAFSTTMITASFYTKPFSVDEMLKTLMIDAVIFIWFIVHNRLLFERLFVRGRYLQYSFWILVAIAVDLGFTRLIFSEQGQAPFPWLPYLLLFLFYTALSFFIYTTAKYFRERKKFYQATILKRDLELQQLKSQLNPHFLFNSLNTIYSYNLENHSKGNDLILKLSQLMRFMLESIHHDAIPINEEILFIDCYIDFEKERLGYRCDIDYKKSITSERHKIPPLILFPFIENAFKHGSDSIEKTKIEIEIEDDDNNLNLTVKNKVIRADTLSTKTGLPNIARRLELLFPGKHELKIDRTQADYSVNLKLEFR